MDSDKLGKVLFMVKSLDRKAELFIHYCKDVQVVGNSIKETCYDMQVLFLDFLTNAINYIHADGDIPRKRMKIPHYRLMQVNALKLTSN